MSATRKKGTRLWTCDECGKRETWRAGWHCLPGIISEENDDGDGMVFPVAFDSDACEDAWLRKAVKP